MIFDMLFLLATVAFGWGLSLATYRMFALRNNWPMGVWQRDYPILPVLIGVICFVVAFLFAAARGSEFGGWIILVLGLLFALVWTSVLRVASQLSLLLAPVAAGLLVMSWVSARNAYEMEVTASRFQPSIQEVPAEQLPVQKSTRK